MIRFATVGTSWITNSFIEGTKLCGRDLKLAAVYSRSAEKGKEFADRFGCEKVYTSLLELAQDREIDAVYIASPNSLHYSQSKLMLENGKHVICEKPITTVHEQLLELIDLAKEKGLIYMEALMAMHLPARQKVLEVLPKLGRISHARFDFSQRSTKFDNFIAGNHENVFDKNFDGGALNDLGIYCIYPVISLFGEPKEITAVKHYIADSADTETAAIINYDDTFVTLTCSKTAQTGIGSEIIGEGGAVIIPSISKLTNVTFRDNEGNETAVTGDCEKPELMSYEAASFYDLITDLENNEDKYKEITETCVKANKLLAALHEAAK